MSAAVQLDFGYAVERRVKVLGAWVTRSYRHESGHTVDVLGEPYTGTEFVYVIHMYGNVARASHYVGSTIDLTRRLKEHQRVWPLYRLTADDIAAICDTVPPQIAGELDSIEGKRFRRKHTFLRAVHECIGFDCWDFPILKAARKHTSNGLIMAANQRSIAWTVARCFQADRNFEYKLKQQHKIRHHCPVCRGEYMPF